MPVISIRSWPVVRETHVLVCTQDFHRQMHREGGFQHVPTTHCFCSQHFLWTALEGCQEHIGQHKTGGGGFVKAQRYWFSVDRVETPSEERDHVWARSLSDQALNREVNVNYSARIGGIRQPG